MSGTGLSVLLFLDLGFAQGDSLAQRDELTKGTNGEPAILPGVRVVLRGPITKETESGTRGAFANDGAPAGTYQIEANAPCFYEELAVKVAAGASSAVPDEINLGAVTSTTSPQRTRLKAMDCVFSRKVHYA